MDKKGIRQGCPLSMLLFGIVIEALIQKINKNHHILGIKFGKETNLKIQACADDITFYITNKRSIDLIMDELKVFGKFSGQKVNQDKTAIILHGHHMRETMMRTLYFSKVTSKLSILNTSFSFSEDLSKQNFIKLFKIMETNVELQKHRGLSIFGKVNIIKSKIISQIFHKLQYMCLSAQKIKQVENLLYEFLWYPEKHELMRRELLIAKLNEGGINMVDFRSKCKAALIFKLKFIVKASEQSEFWIKYAFYNIGTTLKYINPSLYSNTEPHKTIPNFYWNEVAKVLHDVREKNIDWNVVKFKDLYNVFRCGHQLKSDSKIPWKSIHLNDNFRYIFTNKEKEASYLIAQDAIPCGQKIRRMERFVDISRWNLHNCKLCNNIVENAHHIFSGECRVVYKLYQMCKCMYWMTTKKRLCFDKKLVFYNQVDNMKEDYMKVKLMVIIKKHLLIEKAKLDKYHKFVEDQNLFIDNIMIDIKHQFNFSL